MKNKFIVFAFMFLFLISFARSLTFVNIIIE